MDGMELFVLDYDLVRLFRPIIINGLSDLGITAKVLQNYQPTNQGIKDSIVYFHNIGDKNVGHLERLNVWDTDTSTFQSVETQAKITTFQINTILSQDPSNLEITAKDLCTYVNMILQRRSTIATLQNNGVGILWVGEIRNIPFMNGGDNYEYNPSFDFQITHNQTLTGEVSKIDNFNATIKRV